MYSYQSSETASNAEYSYNSSSNANYNTPSNPNYSYNAQEENNNNPPAKEDQTPKTQTPTEPKQPTQTTWARFKEITFLKMFPSIKLWEFFCKIFLSWKKQKSLWNFKHANSFHNQLNPIYHHISKFESFSLQRTCICVICYFWRVKISAWRRPFGSQLEWR